MPVQVCNGVTINNGVMVSAESCCVPPCWPCCSSKLPTQFMVATITGVTLEDGSDWEGVGSPNVVTLVGDINKKICMQYVGLFVGSDEYEGKDNDLCWWVYLDCDNPVYTIQSGGGTKIPIYAFYELLIYPDDAADPPYSQCKWAFGVSFVYKQYGEFFWECVKGSVGGTDGFTGGAVGFALNGDCVFEECTSSEEIFYYFSGENLCTTNNDAVDWGGLQTAGCPDDEDEPSPYMIAVGTGGSVVIEGQNTYPDDESCGPIHDPVTSCDDLECPTDCSGCCLNYKVNILTCQGNTNYYLSRDDTSSCILLFGGADDTGYTPPGITGITLGKCNSGGSPLPGYPNGVWVITLYLPCTDSGDYTPDDPCTVNFVFDDYEDAGSQFCPPIGQYDPIYPDTDPEDGGGCTRYNIPELIIVTCIDDDEVELKKAARAKAAALRIGEAKKVHFPDIDSAVWGPKIWTALHTGVFTIKEENLKEDGPKLIKTVSRKMPCGDCKKHWHEMLKSFPPDFTSSDALFKWTVDRHNDVNQKLGKALFTLEDAKIKWGVKN